MIEPSGTPISLPPNRQTKVPGLGSDQRTTRQATAAGAPGDQAQYDSGFGKVSTAGMSDNPIAVKDHGCYPGSQSKEAAAARFGPGTNSDKNALTSKSGGSGAPPFSEPAGYEARHARKMPGNMGAQSAPEGTSAVSAAPEIRSTKAQGEQPRPGRGDIGVAPGMLFPGIVE